MHDADLAIVGMACRFPGARNKDEFWRNLCAGEESIRTLDDATLTASGVTQEQLQSATYVKRSPVLDDIDAFDARFFGISGQEAALLDPQHRLFLQVGYEALEDAGYVQMAQQGLTGVYASAGGVTTSYLHNLGASLNGVPQGTGSLLHLGNDKDFLATRLSFRLNLTGPGLTIQTACSSALVALHTACGALRLGEIETALVGASCVRVPHLVGYDSAETPLLSADGYCRAFSDEASGTVFGSGVAAVIVRRLADALRDRDHVYAVIKATSINNDGAAKIGYTASSVPGQARTMVRAMAKAGIDADRIGYVECHGTATRVGDPLEIKALEKAFRLDTDAKRICAVGSVKTNIGHLEQAAGMASLIKVALMLKHRMLVPSLNFLRPNPAIDFDTSPFWVVNEAGHWAVKAGEAPDSRIAGINCLGIGGTNAFALLAEAPDADDVCVSDGELEQDGLVCLSARTLEQLQHYLSRLAVFCQERPELDKAALCHTINISRSHHKVRFCGVLGAADDAGAFFSLAAPKDDGPARPRGIREAVYVCNPSRVSKESEMHAFLSLPRHGALRAAYHASERLMLSRHMWCQNAYAQAVYRSLAFEAALYRQMQGWGLRFNQVRGVGFGMYVAEWLDGKTEADKLLDRLDKEIEAISRAASDIDHMPLPGVTSVEAGDVSYEESKRYVVYREGPCTSGGGDGVLLALCENDGCLTPSSLQAFLCRHLALGFDIDWQAYYRDEPADKIPLPTYPFSTERHWYGSD
ncbi:polyketide synthase [Chromobacterium sp. IIBBL 290-4]|uniref:beta-ketoacyl synthase N-terminal-like domain-containing protein n=1 Tax=Chromobacterium sp. IIBBL 290-4 TaxID=2953890 RepID=UPI0020B6EEAB|nr:polyketide synthase [Chromobacterium sp. IIBBL 290-4]UTH76454.1 polyketide synthase [Chromobacterium sp. IIBBL 290-4]